MGSRLDINVTGTARVVAAALPHLRKSPHAAVVNVGSHRRSHRPPEPRTVLGVQRRNPRADLRRGDRPRPRGYPCQLREPGTAAGRRFRAAPTANAKRSAVPFSQASEQGSLPGADRIDHADTVIVAGDGGRNLR